MADSRRGHVDRARTYGPGSVFARIADEQRQLQQEAEAEFDAAENQEELEQAQVTWPELWDARYNCTETPGLWFSCEVIMLWLANADVGAVLF